MRSRKRWRSGMEIYPSTAEVSVQDPSFPTELCPEKSADPLQDVLKDRAPWKDRGGWDVGLEQDDRE